MLHIRISTYKTGAKKILCFGKAGYPQGVCITEEEGDFYEVVGCGGMYEGETILDPHADGLRGTSGFRLSDTDPLYDLRNVYETTGHSVFLLSVDDGKAIGRCARVLLPDGDYLVDHDGTVTPANELTVGC
jgi:hypothetical protein